jgi:tRNA A-37 threonylcarbamoyl transferase component Bud32
MREIIQRHLVAPPGTAYQVQECRITNRHGRDGSSGTVHYEIHLENLATGDAWNQIVTGITYGGMRTRRFWESIRRSPELDADPAVRMALRPFAYVPELDLLLQVFPHDHRMPALAQLIAGSPPELVPAIAEEFGPDNWELVSWDAETVQYRVDMRAILRLTISMRETSTGLTSERQLYAKVYRGAEEGRRAQKAQYDLHQCAAALATHLVVAKPIIYADELHTLVTTAVPGTSLSEIIGRGLGSVDAVKSAARAVAQFHQLEVDAPHRPLAEDMARLHKSQEFLASARPDLAGEVGGIVQAVALGLESAPVSLIHGDLKPDHILIDGDRVGLIDFDLLAVADPVVDVAHLLAFLHKPEKRSRSLGQATENIGQIFVDEYFSYVPDSWRARLPLYHTMTSIHRAASLSKRPGANEKYRVEDVLQEGQAFLARGADGSLPSYKRRLTRSAGR